MIPLSDASVEAAGKYLHGRYYTANRDSYWDRLSENEKIDFYDTARAAITAYLQAEIEAGRAREARGTYGHPDNGGHWVVSSSWLERKDYLPALIIKLEPSK